jgi:hypothetical protein
VPDEDKVESVAVSFSAIPSIYCTDGSIGWDYCLEEMEITGNESTRKLLEHGARVTRPMRRGEYDDVIENGEWNSTSIQVKYHLKNGKNIYRSYVINLEEEGVLGWVNDTYCDLEHRLAAYPVLQDGMEERYVGIETNSIFGNSMAYLSEIEMKEVVEAYRFDLMSMQVYDLMEEYPVAELRFLVDSDEQNQENEKTVVVMETAEYYSGMEESYLHYYEEYGYRIYTSFTRTIATLEKYGIEIKDTMPAEDILSLTVMDYTREVYDNDGYMTKVAEVTYTNEAGQTAQIEAILPSLLEGGYYRSFAKETGSEENINVSIRYYSEDGYDNYVSCEFKKGDMPDFVKQDLDDMYQSLQANE